MQLKVLKITLLGKIWITTLLWCIPLLFFPKALYDWIGFKNFGSLVFLKLLGIAYLALLVGYYFGYCNLRNGKYPKDTVRVGIVSNFGAFLILVYSAFFNTWSGWGFYARVFMWLSLFLTGLISFGLFFYGECGFKTEEENTK